MVQKGTTEIYCQLCSEPMTPEKARKDRGGWIICRPCYMADNTDATQEEIDQAIKEDFPG
jgi:formylmethanofuran dehydrogenase subunit E